MSTLKLQVELRSKSKQIIDILDIYTISIAPRIHKHLMEIIDLKWECYAKSELDALKGSASPQELNLLIKKANFELFEKVGIQPHGNKLASQVQKIKFNHLHQDERKDPKPTNKSQVIFENISIMKVAAMEDYRNPIGIFYARTIGRQFEKAFEPLDVMNNDIDRLLYNYSTASRLSEDLDNILRHLEKGTAKKKQEQNLNNGGKGKLSDEDIRNIKKEYNQIVVAGEVTHLKGNGKPNKSAIATEIKKRHKLSCHIRTISRNFP